MKINNLPGSYRPEPIKSTPKKSKFSQAESAASAVLRGARRDEYVQRHESIMPKLPDPALYARAASADPQDMEADGLDDRIENLLNLIAGDTGESAESQKAGQLGGQTPDYSIDTSSGTAALLTIDVYRKGFQCGYTEEDAAATLWVSEYTVISFSDPASLARLRERVRSGNLNLNPSAEELDAYTERLRRDGLSDEVAWSDVTRELLSFGSTPPDELEDSLDYLASRYAAIMDKLARGCSGEGLAAEREKLERVYRAGTDRLIGGYTAGLQENFNLSGADVKAIEDSLAAILDERTAAYETAVARVRESVGRMFPEDTWLQNHDAYIAAKLREAGGEAGGTKALYSAQDLSYMGEIAQAYRREAAGAASGCRDEADLALNLAMADMKAEVLIERGLVSGGMAALLRSSRAQSHSVALDAADGRMAYRESTRLSGERAGSFPAMDRELFSGVYSAVMDAFRMSGDAAGAIRAGAAYGQEATAKAGSEHPEALRWGQSMENYWKDFFTAPQSGARDGLEREIDDLLAQIGQSRSAVNSTYQNYMNGWQNFLTSLDRAGDGMPPWF